jgi:hypothetical protein
MIKLCKRRHLRTALRDDISNCILKHFSVQGNAPTKKAQNDQMVTSVRMNLKTDFVINREESLLDGLTVDFDNGNAYDCHGTLL